VKLLQVPGDAAIARVDPVPQQLLPGVGGLRVRAVVLPAREHPARLLLNPTGEQDE
jgi:hypothetical protein